MNIKNGDIVTGVVTGIQPYGAFVSINPTTSGLIHISEISEGFVRDVHQFVEINDKVTVKVIDIDEGTHQARLSLKALHSSNRKDRVNVRYNKTVVPKLGFSSIEKALPTWINERLEEIKEVK